MLKRLASAFLRTITRTLCGVIAFAISFLVIQCFYEIGGSAGQRATYAAVIFWSGLAVIVGSIAGSILYDALCFKMSDGGGDSFRSLVICLAFALVVAVLVVWFFVPPLLPNSIFYLLVTLVCSVMLFGSWKKFVGRANRIRYASSKTIKPPPALE